MPTGFPASSSMKLGFWESAVALDPVWRAYVTPKAVLIPIVFLFVMTSLAVLYPAIKAALIQPVRAIHHR